MKYIQGIDRRQMALFPVLLEEAVYEDNEVRLIELFVDLNIPEYIEPLIPECLLTYLQALFL